MAGNVTVRTIEKGPLSSHSSPVDPALTACHSNPLKVIVPCYPQILRRTHPNGPCQFYTHFFLHTISSFPLRGHERGISQKEMPELWRRCFFSLYLCILNFFYHSSACFFSRLCNHIQECRVLIKRCQKKKKNTTLWMTLFLLSFSLLARK